MPITQSMLQVAASHPERLAIVGDRLRLTYRQLVDDGARVQAAVEHLLGPDRDATTAGIPEAQGRPIVGICLTDAAQTGRLIAGLAGFGAISATIDPRWPVDHQLRVIHRTQMAIVITDSTTLRQRLHDWTGKVITSTAFDELTRTLPSASAPTVRDGDEPFLLLFSSGTTSAPKGFIRTRREYRYNIAVSSRYLEALDGERTLAPGPISYSLTLYALLEVLASGGTCSLSDSFSPIPLVSRMRDEHIERIVAVPAAVQGIAQAARHEPAAAEHLRLLVTGGANLSASVRESVQQTFPGVPLISYYGAAEIGFIGDSRGGDGTRIHPYDGVEISIRDPHGQPVPDGQIGELQVRVPSTAAGYVAALTDEHLVDDAGWATVHDQGRLVDGALELVGRPGDIVVTGGHKVSLPEVERALAEIPGCERSCAVAVPDRTLGSIVVAVIEHDERDAGAVGLPTNVEQPTKAQLPTKAELLGELRRRLAPQFVPRRFCVVARLPRTVGGKVRRSETARLIEVDGPEVTRL
ncbi:acyl--CoA ligase [Pseudoclavibacter sp. CFCC 14310]|uniref:class I adenylate-forming enzyme family protein n=1 Tax=Pseudoclavibacter sp. CFCC 14310 TaxID=2615180 RepID=UPI001300DA92|nr:class I adenylate-forming enzyme family protein [Pseudoclavibacter sp. CFCC 14310]KAB1646488.1 acyl--CoA ligase [Pseudoclavibacter sp. CFCC 14310]